MIPASPDYCNLVHIQKPQPLPSITQCVQICALSIIQVIGWLIGYKPRGSK
jgi:hypothetical protein